VRDLLDELEQKLKAYGAPIAGALRHGAAPEHVREALAAEGVPAHDDLVTWWGWHDGVEIDAPAVESGPGIYQRGENTLVGPWLLLSLADAIRIRRWFRELHDRAGIGHLLPDAWVPVLTTDGAGELFADAAASGAAPLHILDEGYLEVPPPQFASLAEFVELLSRAFDEGFIGPDAMDARAPQVAEAALKTDLRRLIIW
jgi:hypothetical protein